MDAIFEKLDTELVITREKKKRKSKNNKVVKIKKEESQEIVSIHNIKLIRTSSSNIDNTMDITGKTLMEGIKEMQSIKRNKEALKTTPYRKRKFILTRAEKILYDLIDKLVGDRVIILSKVRLADVIEFTGKQEVTNPNFMKIAMKHLDFVLLDKNKELICAVELDDYTHDTERMAKSDLFKTEVLYDCGIPLFRTRKRIDEIELFDLKPLHKIVLDYYAPKCSVCGRGMEIRETYKRVMFYGCKGFPDSCRNTTSIGSA